MDSFRQQLVLALGPVTLIGTVLVLGGTCLVNAWVLLVTLFDPLHTLLEQLSLGWRLLIEVFESIRSVIF